MKESSIFLPQMPKSLLISITAIMAALIAVLTISFQIAVPATQGYFNLGEVGVYISALLFGPIIGGLAGGIGSMTADLATGYVIYAPGTLVIKGMEGFLVGYLSFAFRDRLAPKQLRYLGMGLGIGLAICLAVIGVLRFSGEIEFIGGPEVPWWQIPFFLPSWVWFILAGVLGSMTVFITVRYEPKAAWNVFAMLLGGIVMISGYFLYELMIFGTAAIAELPVNFMQVMIGIMVALPITERLLPTLKNLGWIS
ncbi:MAG: ECF transporter S component [Candidatus Odinarchaeota archaeon]